MPTKRRTLQDVVDGVPSVTEHLYHNDTGARTYPVVRPEYTNWRDEQRSWRQSVCLRDQSYHMSDLYVSGPDARRLLHSLAINSFEGFEPERAKQLVVCSPEGFVIGDGILFHLERDRFQLVGRPSANNWIEYQAAVGGHDVELERDEWSVDDPGRRRKVFRYQLRGPRTEALMDKLTGGAFRPIGFFRIGWTTVAGHRVRFLSWPGVEGVELFGPLELGEEVKAAVAEAGEELGLRLVGSRTYAINGLEQGWIPSPLPAVYTSPELRHYREWLPATSYEATGSLGGSFYSEDVEDYYLTPWDLGYGRIVKFDHDFVGRDALEERADGPHRRKVTLAWNGEDVARVLASLFADGTGPKYVDLPLAQYATWMYDEVRDARGAEIGLSTFCGYSWNERSMLSLAMLDAAHAEPGTEVVLVWGERGGGSRKPSVEEHVQTEVRATVGPAPYSDPVRRDREAITRR
ncbi:MAG: aminomethyl transferase family protein [Acidimicrobiales bacterium]